MNAIILEQRATMDNLLTKVTVSSVMILQYVSYIRTVIGLCISWILLIKMMMMKTAVLFIAVLVGCF